MSVHFDSTYHISFCHPCATVGVTWVSIFFTAIFAEQMPFTNLSNTSLSIQILTLVVSLVVGRFGFQNRITDISVVSPVSFTFFMFFIHVFNLSIFFGHTQFFSHVHRCNLRRHQFFLWRIPHSKSRKYHTSDGICKFTTKVLTYFDIYCAQ